MKVFLFLVLCTLGVQAKVAIPKQSDYLCKGTDSYGRAITIKYNSWADVRKSARADVTFDINHTGAYTYIDLYVTAGDSDSFGGDIAVSNGSWSLDFYFYPSGVTARYYNGKEKVVNLNCVKANF